ncbi:PucR family transcriptional regulator [Tomitella biformata]|uniref:PucR family transcriptional regulator n=1 Tax=Tomitella biformata TaxID=630403 RepID=UPI000466D0FE|nr:helix-turn-helix domain-containing protein [Tomitella biformata]
MTDDQPEKVLSEMLLRRIKRNSRRLAVEAMRSMEQQLPFVRELDASQRADVQMVVQTAVSNFVDWLQNPDGDILSTVQAFRVVPQDLTRKVKLRETVDMVRVAMEFFETWLPLMARDQAQLVLLTESVLRYGRDLGFAAAAVYASAAEARGAWDTRLEAMVVDAIVRGDSGAAMLSQAATLNWQPATTVTAIVGSPPPSDRGYAVGHVHAVASRHGRSALAVVQGTRLVLVVSGEVVSGEPGSAGEFTEELLEAFADGPVVIGRSVQTLGAAHESAQEALRGFQAVVAWRGAPRPVHASELLPERALLGDRTAFQALEEVVIAPLVASGGALSDTLDSFLDCGSSIERCARELYVHPNTVRYRLRKIAAVTGRDPSDARDAYVLKVALSASRMVHAGLLPFTEVTKITPVT